jgi:hypothetical protein
MSELTLLNQNLPAHLRTLDGVDDVTRALMGGSGGGGIKRISIDGGVWRMMVNGNEVARNEDRVMNVVIVNAAQKVSRTFYAAVYKKGEVAAPDCWSADGEVPDAKAKAPQSKTCASCPQNIKGSGAGDSRACRFSQRLAVVLENDIGGDVYQLTLPSKSIFGEGEPNKWPLQMYAKMLGSKGVPISSVVTEMRFDTDSSTPKITFKGARFLEQHEFDKAMEQAKSDAAIKAITMTVSQADGVDSKTAPEVPKLEAKAAPKAEPKAEEVEVVEEAEEVKEPVKRAAKKEEAPAPKKNIADILDEWDD